MNDDLLLFLQAWTGGAEVSPAERSRLLARVRDDEAFRTACNEEIRLLGMLHAAQNPAPAWPDLQAAIAAVGPSASAQPAGRNQPITFRQLAATAASLVLLIGGVLWWHDSQQVIATVVNDAGAEDLSNGTSIRKGLHRFEAGVVELMTSQGARLTIEAPAEFRFESAQRLRMTQGRLSAEVPPSAKGFTVITPSGQAVDLGTRFGVDVPAIGPAEIHVFKGEVVAKAAGDGRTLSLRDGKAVTMAKGLSVERELRSSAFIHASEMDGLSAGLSAGQRARSEAATAALWRDPSLIALLDFSSGEPQPGVYRTVQGRWPGSRAAEFVNAGDHLKLDVGGDREWPQLTLAAWVRLDRLGAPYQSLLHTDGWHKGTPGQVHWMVTQLMTMRLALYANTLPPGAEEVNGFPDSRTSVLPEQGRWAHFATVYDAEKKTVRFYLNGRFDKESLQAVAHPARLGKAQVGNWDRQDRKLSGRVDELLLLGRAMTDEEIWVLFAAGNPYR
ncbi:MAG: hypothetical protein EXS26_03040 [Opitutales bacterium]|nr:hypothetical protein [Opitutales bacterium]